MPSDRVSAIPRKGIGGLLHSRHEGKILMLVRSGEMHLLRIEVHRGLVHRAGGRGLGSKGVRAERHVTHLEVGESKEGTGFDRRRVRAVGAGADSADEGGGTRVVRGESDATCGRRRGLVSAEVHVGGTMRSSSEGRAVGGSGFALVGRRDIDIEGGMGAIGSARLEGEEGGEVVAHGGRAAAE